MASSSATPGTDVLSRRARKRIREAKKKARPGTRRKEGGQGKMRRHVLRLCYFFFQSFAPRSPGGSTGTRSSWTCRGSRWPTTWRESASTTSPRRSSWRGRAGRGDNCARLSRTWQASLSLSLPTLRFEKPYRPVVVTGATDRWPAQQKWTVEVSLELACNLSACCVPLAAPHPSLIRCAAPGQEVPQPKVQVRGGQRGLQRQDENEVLRGLHAHH